MIGIPKRVHLASGVMIASFLAVLLLVYCRLQSMLSDPSVFYLAEDADAAWIRHSLPTQLNVITWTAPTFTRFRSKFDLEAPVSDALLHIKAFRRCDVWIDADPGSTAPLFSSSRNLDSWKKNHQLRLPRTLDRGKHTIMIHVTNKNAHPCLLAFCRELRISTGRSWQTSLNGKDWKPAEFASALGSDVLENVAEGGYPDVTQSFRLLWPWLLLTFGIGFCWSFWTTFGVGSIAPNLRYRISPRLAGNVFVVAWILLSLNNISKINSFWGYDVRGHVKYVAYVAENWRVPLANEGWQMFQSPLIYLVTAPWYYWISHTYGPEWAAKMIRVVPMLCGLAQIEILYRIGRTLFPDNDDQQTVVLTIGCMLPVNVYMSQVFGNEPLAACLTSLLILFCVTILMDTARPRSIRFFLMMGLAWGLALLSKVTPVLLTPLIFSLVVYHSVKSHRSFRYGLNRMTMLLLGCCVTCGWYYLRNWVYLGKPFVGGWDPAGFGPWWQDPSYRCWTQLTSFGTALRQPIYSGVVSYWDALYSTFWADGFLSGTVNPPIEAVPWNIPWMEIGVVLSIAPMSVIAAGLLTMWRRELMAARPSLLFAVGAIGIYLAAVTDLYVRLPIFSTAKASYLLGLVPCIAILGAAGAAPILRLRLLRPLFWGLLGTWAMSSYATFFCIK